MPMAKKKKRSPVYTKPRTAASSASVPTPAKGAGRDPSAAARQARKAEARKAREAYRRRASRSRLIRRAAAGVVVVAAGAVALFLLTRPPGTAVRTVDPAKLPGMQRTDPLQWNDGAPHLEERLTKMRFPPLDVEGTGLHSDQQLDIFVHGRKVQIPAGIGIGPGFDNQKSSSAPEDFISTLHTHDTTGTVHVEAHDTRVYTLGLFFDVWGVYFTDSCLGDLCTKGSDRLRVYSDGTLQSDPVNLGFSHTPHSQTVVVTYGTEQELPNPIPGS
jgi:hypothetical protein